MESLLCAICALCGGLIVAIEMDQMVYKLHVWHMKYEYTWKFVQSIAIFILGIIIVYPLLSP